ncbi:FKBP-type peptidyl-prolyl cis-trans isomerase [Desertivirga arenae]|uniref:FKBP-type peptidyl-prolyl cis-trans isomerase n=1 Tax=Desertivirga arenae TaxID=2810309 RepID=UPI001A96C693|nr:FKBP-type peptidyl-prolyl cis-trans isomerase [Pedobacter sp. SYSU D00823]
MKSYLYKLPLLFFSVLLLATSCKKEYESVEEIDTKNISDYISKSNLNYTKNDSLNIWYSVVKPGAGADLKFSEIVPLVFTVRSLDGRYASVDTFAASNRYGSLGEGVTSNDFLGYFGSEKGYPNALKYAVVNFLKKRGGEIKVIVPSRLAYGVNGGGSIPSNASLEYDIRVVNEKDIINYDDLSLRNFMTSNGLSGFTKIQKGDSIVYYKISDPGTGSSITKDSTISFVFTGRLLNGKIFQQNSESSVFPSLLAQLVPGLQLTIPLIKEGGSLRVLIPSRLAYGIYGSRDDQSGQVMIPPASCLDFDIKVTDVTK